MITARGELVYYRASHLLGQDVASAGHGDDELDFSGMVIAVEDAMNFLAAIQHLPDRAAPKHYTQLEEATGGTRWCLGGGLRW